MFVSRPTLMDRLADAIDLVVDFATLGEYGFEAVNEERPMPACVRGGCEATVRGTTAWEGLAAPRRGGCAPQSHSPRSIAAISSRTASSARRTTSRSMFRGTSDCV